MSNSAPYKAVIAGCGLIAGLNGRTGDAILSHAGMYAGHPAFTLAGACDPDAGRRAQFASQWNLPVTTATLPELIEQTRPDVVSITSPDATHPALVRLCRDHGVPVIVVEKPIATTAADARTLAAEDMRGSRVVVNYQRRFQPGFRDLQARLVKAGFGQIHHVSLLYPGDLVHIGVHAIDLLRWLFGEPQDARLLRLREQGNTKLADALFQFHGHSVSLHAIPRAPANVFECDIISEAGRFRFSLGGREFGFQAPEPDPQYPHLQALRDIAAPFADGWSATYPTLGEHIADLLRDPAHAPLCTLQDGLASLSIAESLLSQTPILQH